MTAETGWRRHRWAITYSVIMSTAAFVVQIADWVIRSHG